jgi:carboxylate-amine ligase
MSEPLRLFEGYGIEMEYMLVNQHNLQVYPASDKLLMAVAGEITDEIALGDIAWSNELVLHVVELKTNGPAASINGLANKFQENIIYINSLLDKDGAKLLPTGAHPLMNPDTDARLWPHGYNEVYEIFNRIFNCRGHGWSNLQSTHLNLPFANDTEFALLHTAIRLILPLLPALAASTPVIEGQVTGLVDTRLQYYLSNQTKIPSITGHVVPEAVLSKRDYQERILNRIYQDIAPFDPNKVLQFEWLNSRGAIARFDRNAIEIRTLDIQECPQADLGIVALIVATLQAIIDEQWHSFADQAEWSEQTLSAIWRDVIKHGQDTVIDNRQYLSMFGYVGSSATARDIWQHIYQQVFHQYTTYESVLQQSIECILEKGNLAERILQRCQHHRSQDDILAIYQDLSLCLAQGKMFE